MKRLIIFGLLLALFVVGAFPVQASDEIKIGVLAKRGAETCMKKWMPTAEYISEKLGQPVRIIPMKFDAVPKMLEMKKVDFFLVNSSMYCNMSKQYGGTAVATLRNARQGNALTQFSGVLFTKADSPIKTVQDVKGSSFMCVKLSSFGGYQMVLRMLKNNGIDPEKDCKLFKEAGTHDKVVNMVLEGVIDVGTVRSDTIERMIAEGKYKMSDFRILNPQDDGFPFVHSTTLYPEWPMASCDWTNPETVSKVADALITMPEDSPAAKAGKCLGWTKSLDYTSVNQLLTELKIGAFAGIE